MGAVGSVIFPIQPFSFSLPFLPPFSLSFLPLPKYTYTSGFFSLLTDNHGLPSKLQAIETSGVAWPWKLDEMVWTKKYKTELGPFSRQGGFGREVGVLRASIGLVFERSNAGEELRMLLFTTSLAILAVWGFAVGGRREALEYSWYSLQVLHIMIGVSLWVGGEPEE